MDKIDAKTPGALCHASEVLAKSIDRWTGNENQVDTKIPGLRLSRWEPPTEPTSYTLEPSVCLIARGPSGCCWERRPTCMTRPGS